MLPIIKDIEEQALNIQYMTHNLAKWLDNTARRLESIKEQCLRETEQLRDLDKDLQANKSPKVQQENNSKIFNFNSPDENIKQKDYEFKKYDGQELQQDHESDLVAQNVSQQFQDRNVRKRKISKKQQKKKEKFFLNQSPDHITCQICFSNYKEIVKYENHMKRFHRIQDFSYNNQQSQPKNQEYINTDIPLESEI